MSIVRRCIDVLIVWEVAIYRLPSRELVNIEMVKTVACFFVLCALIPQLTAKGTYVSFQNHALV